MNRNKEENETDIELLKIEDVNTSFGLNTN